MDCNTNIYLCLLSIIGSLLVETFGLYEDQIGKLDWRHQYVGKVLFVKFDQSGTPSGKRIFVGTEQNVISSLTARTGEIGWRHLFERGASGKINDIVLEGLCHSNSGSRFYAKNMTVVKPKRQSAASLVVVTGGGQFVRCFNPSMGNLLWEASVEHDVSDHKARLLMVSENTVAVLTKTTLLGFNIETGAKRWVHSLPNRLISIDIHHLLISAKIRYADESAPYADESACDTVAYSTMYEEDGLVTVVGRTSNSHVTMVTFDETSRVSDAKVPAAWINANTQCSVTFGKVVVCLDPYSRSLQVLGRSPPPAAGAPPTPTFTFTQRLLLELGLTGHQDVSLMSLQEPGDTALNNIVAIRLGNRHIAVVIISPMGTVSLLKDLQDVSTVQLMQHAEQTLLLSLSRQDNELKLRTYSALTGAELPDMAMTITYPAHHGLPLELFSHIFKKRDGTNGARVVLLSQDHSVTLLQQYGKVAWTREEALASIVTMEMVDLPVSQLQQEMEEDFAQKGAGQYDVLAMFTRRFHSQFTQLKTLVLSLKSRLKVPRHGHTVSDDDIPEDDPTDDITKEEYLTRDEFNLHKMVVAISTAGKLFGIDGFSGRPVWRYLLPDLVPFDRFGSKRVPLFVQRTTAHFPHLPQCTVIGKHRLTGQGLLFSFNPIAGTPSDDMPPGGQILNYDVTQVTMLHTMDDCFLRPLIILDNHSQYHVYPESGVRLVEIIAPAMFMYTTDVDSGMLRGYGMKHGPLNTLVANELWTVNLQRDSQVITNVEAKKSNEQVHSQGIVLGDRSVLFKYINPNLVVVTTEGSDPTQKSANFVNVYLIDVVSGAIVFHCNHKKAKGPVRVVHSENWVIYNYWNQKFRRNELAVLELYEGQKQSNSTAFSSLTIPQLPIVMRQAYVFPGYISQMAATITEKGITNKHVLIAMETGGILEMPKALLDPRRPVILTQDNKEEGMIPYMPELPRPYEAFINYNQSIYNIVGIATAPAGLESTCLIVSYGLDMFGTRVMPSKMFDVLKEDFDYLFIALVLAAMILVSFITQKLAARKALKRAWR